MKAQICALFLALCVSSSSYATSRNTSNLWLSSKFGVQQCNVFSGGPDHPSRKTVYDYIHIAKISEVLEVGCGSCIDAENLQKEKVVRYIGIDINKKLLQHASRLGFTVHNMQANLLNFPDNFIQCVYARYLLEHLPSYEAALSEMIRVASKEVIVILSMTSHGVKDRKSFKKSQLGNYWHNAYTKAGIETWLKSHPKVLSIFWQGVNDSKDSILHIHLK